MDVISTAPGPSEGYINVEQTNCNLEELVEVPDSIIVTLHEEIEVKGCVRIDQKSKDAKIRGRMAVECSFNRDRFVEVQVGELDGLRLRIHPLIDKNLLYNQKVIKPKNPTEPFPPRLFDILTWEAKSADTVSYFLPSLPFEVTVYLELVPKLANHEWDNFYIVDLHYKASGIINLQDVVITIPVPRVDAYGHKIKVDTHIWKNRGHHRELEDSVEWRITSIDQANSSGYMQIDYYCYGGGPLQAPQFYPVRASFTYLESLSFKVMEVNRSSDGLPVDFTQNKLGVGHYELFDQWHEARREAEAEAAAQAWQEEPWDDH